jgi:hypothetical protein
VDYAVVGPGGAGQDHVGSAEQLSGGLVGVHYLPGGVLHDNSARQCVVEPAQALGLMGPTPEPAASGPRPETQADNERGSQQYDENPREGHAANPFSA